MAKTETKLIALAEVARTLGARLIGGDGQRPVTGVNTLQDAGPNEISFLTNVKLKDQLPQTRAAAVLVDRELSDCSVGQLIVDHVNKALIIAMRLFAPTLKPLSGRDPTAVIDSTASVDPTAAVGPYAVIGPDAAIGPHTIVGPGCVIGQGTVVGARCQLDANVVIYHFCRIGDDCVIQANATIGSVGFGYVFIDGQHRLIPHNGGVILENGVEIGAGTCIDRAKFGNTVIGAGTKIDNLVQIGHNVRIGKACLLAGQTGLSGSVVIHDGVVLAGQVGVADHRVIADGVMAGARSLISENVPAGQKVLGFPARDIKAEMKSISLYRKLPDIVKQIKELEKKVERLEAAKNHQD